MGTLGAKFPQQHSVFGILVVVICCSLEVCHPSFALLLCCTCKVMIPSCGVRGAKEPSTWQNF
jgi:hypothetical protein